MVSLCGAYGSSNAAPVAQDSSTTKPCIGFNVSEQGTALLAQSESGVCAAMKNLIHETLAT
jgi:hypothetical protein